MMAEHSELVAELPLVEKMATQDRLKHAKKRRGTQLKKFSQYDKHIEKENKRKKTQGTKKVVKKTKTTRVQFASNIMLLEAAGRNDVNEVDSLLGGSINPDVTNEDGLTALHQCCIDDQETMLKILLKYNANVNAQDSELWTPLHAAATCGHVHLCKLLVDHGAELLAVNADGNMPYDICEDDVTLDFIESEMAKRGVTQELIDETRLSSERKMLEDMIDLAQNGRDLEFRGRSGETPLHIAAANGFIQVSEFLVDQHVALDITDDDTWQPIHAAACWGHLHILELLVQHGADLDARTKSGETPLDICEDHEIRQRIMEMRDEIQSHKATKSRDLKRRRSQNSRSGPALYSSNSSLADKASASIRRTSMREKTPMALREAREEAQRLRNSTASTDEEEDAPTRKAKADAVAGHSINGVLEEEESPTTPDSIQLKVSSYDTETTTSDDTPEPPVTADTAEPEAEPEPELPPAEKLQTRELDNDRPTENSLSVDTNSMNNGTKPPKPESFPPKNKPPSSPKPSKRTLPPPGERNRAQSTASTGSAVTQSSTNSHQQSEHSHTSPSITSATDSTGNTPRGTLADLKKYRAQKVQDNIRSKDSSSMSSHGDEYSVSHSDSENNIVVVSPNGQNTAGHNGLHKNNAYVSGDTPKHKFTASRTEIIGGDEAKTSCCTIL